MVSAQTIGPTLIEEGKIKLDGEAGDWFQNKAILSEFGKAEKKPGKVTVSLFHMAYTKSQFVFKAFLSPQIEKFKSNADQSILHINFDLDSNPATGISGEGYLILKPSSYRGYEYRYDLLKVRGKLVGRLYSSKDKFSKPIKEWQNGDKLLRGKKNNAEFAVPYNLMGFKASGKKKVKILFTEVSNAQTREDGTGGFKSKIFSLDYSKVVASSKSSSSDSGDATTGGLNIMHLILITLWIVSILCSFAIVPKAGLSTGLAAINLVPFIGQIIFLFILAFTEWPLHKDYQNLEDRISDYEE
jgi:hypothetical protein